MPDLFLFRHGTAEETRPGLPDPERALTPEGRDRFARAARFWAPWFPEGTVLLCSPYRRARETAALLRDALPGHPPLEEEDLLVHWTDPLDLCRALPEAESLCLVTHMPLVGRLVSMFLLGSPDRGFPVGKGMGIWLRSRTPWSTGGGARLLAAVAQRAAISSSDRESRRSKRSGRA